MKIAEALNIRQYKIILAEDTEELSLDELKSFGTWINPLPNHYVVMLQSNELSIANPEIFEKAFREKIGLSSAEAQIEATYGPFNLQRAADQKWF